jgi:ribosomal-protein-alanine N-acetyltransferase
MSCQPASDRHGTGLPGRGELVWRRRHRAERRRRVVVSSLGVVSVAWRGGELSDGRVTLRPSRLAEAGWYAEQTRDPLIQQNTCEPADLTAEQVRTAILMYANDPQHRGWAIVATDTGELLGNTALNLDTGTVSYWVALAARGRGVASAAVRLLADYAFGAGSLTELRLWVRAGNRASARMAENAGFLCACPRPDR